MTSGGSLHIGGAKYNQEGASRVVEIFKRGNGSCWESFVYRCGGQQEGMGMHEGGEMYSTLGFALKRL